MNHLQSERTVLPYHPGVNSCSSGSIAVWMPCMYESLRYSRFDCLELQSSYFVRLMNGLIYAVICDVD